MNKKWIAGETELMNEKMEPHTIEAFHGTVMPKGEIISSFDLSIPLAPVVTRGYIQKGGEQENLRIPSIWFSESPEVASQYADGQDGQVYRVAIDAKRPVRTDRHDDDAIAEALALNPDVLIVEDAGGGDEVVVLDNSIVRVMDVTDSEGEYIRDFSSFKSPAAIQVRDETVPEKMKVFHGTPKDIYTPTPQPDNYNGTGIAIYATTDIDIATDYARGHSNPGQTDDSVTPKIFSAVLDAKYICSDPIEWGVDWDENHFEDCDADAHIIPSDADHHLDTEVVVHYEGIRWAQEVDVVESAPHKKAQVEVVLVDAKRDNARADVSVKDDARDDLPPVAPARVKPKRPRNVASVARNKKQHTQHPFYRHKKRMRNARRGSGAMSRHMKR